MPPVPPLPPFPASPSDTSVCQAASFRTLRSRVKESASRESASAPPPTIARTAFSKLNLPTTPHNGAVKGLAQDPVASPAARNHAVMLMPSTTTFAPSAVTFSADVNTFSSSVGSDVQPLVAGPPMPPTPPKPLVALPPLVAAQAVPTAHETPLPLPSPKRMLLSSFKVPLAPFVPFGATPSVFRVVMPLRVPPYGELVPPVPPITLLCTKLVLFSTTVPPLSMKMAPPAPRPPPLPEPPLVE